MVRHARAEQVEATPRPVVAVGNEYPAGHLHPAHRHRRAQLLYGASGVMIVETAQGSWIVPPQQAVWIPGGVQHAIRMLGAVATRSAYVEPTMAAGLPDRCQVVGVGPLLRCLLLEAVDLPTDYAPDGRAGQIMQLLLSEIRAAPALPLCVPFPSDPRLAALCRRFITAPTPHATIEGWSGALGMSRRAFTRRFRRQTGLSFAAWRRQACLVAAIPRLAAGQPVTTVALDLGYASPAAFTAMFRHALGVPPSQCRGDAPLAAANLPGRRDSAGPAATLPPRPGPRPRPDHASEESS